MTHSGVKNPHATASANASSTLLDRFVSRMDRMSAPGRLRTLIKLKDRMFPTRSGTSGHLGAPPTSVRSKFYMSGGFRLP